MLAAQLLCCTSDTTNVICRLPLRRTYLCTVYLCNWAMRSCRQDLKTNGDISTRWYRRADYWCLIPCLVTCFPYWGKLHLWRLPQVWQGVRKSTRAVNVVWSCCLAQKRSFLPTTPPAFRMSKGTLADFGSKRVLISAAGHKVHICSLSPGFILFRKSERSRWVKSLWLRMRVFSIAPHTCLKEAKSLVCTSRVYLTDSPNLLKDVSQMLW